MTTFFIFDACAAFGAIYNDVSQELTTGGPSESRFVVLIKIVRLVQLCRVLNKVAERMESEVPRDARDIDRLRAAGSRLRHFQWSGVVCSRQTLTVNKSLSRKRAERPGVAWELGGRK